MKRFKEISLVALLLVGLVAVCTANLLPIMSRIEVNVSVKTELDPMADADDAEASYQDARDIFTLHQAELLTQVDRELFTLFLDTLVEDRVCYIFSDDVKTRFEKSLDLLLDLKKKSETAFRLESLIEFSNEKRLRKYAKVLDLAVLAEQAIIMELEIFKQQEEDVDSFCVDFVENLQKEPPI